MNVEFASNELRVRATSEREAVRAWGPLVGRKYSQRIRFIYSARDIHALAQVRSFRVHPLRGSREGMWSMVLHDRWRLIFTLPDPASVRIEEVSNHYDD